MTLPVLFRHHFQTAYVVRDLAGASAAFREHLGISKWHVLPLPDGSPVRRIGLAYVQNLMIELIEADPGQESIYRSWVPESDTAARFHHHGFLIDNTDEFHQAARQFEASGFRTAMAGNSGDILDFHYADTVDQLGHFCELVHLRPAGQDFFAAVPQN
jgi:hypothetical protein